MRLRRASRGFALPTVVITSVVMFALLVAATGTVASSSESINTQYYEALAADAAESGSNHAVSCLSDNGQASTWGTGQLHPNTTCSGGAACTGSANCYVVKTDSYTSTYTVSPVADTGTGRQTVSVVGTVNLLRTSDRSVWKTYTKTLKIQAGGQISANKVIFGYYGYGSAFFATIGGDGLMRATGYNGQGQLGNGTYTAATTPRQFVVPTSSPIVAAYTSFVSLGSSLFAVDADGVAYGAGLNSSGQIGVGSTATNIPTPRRVAIPGNKQVKAITVRGSTNYFVTTDGNVYAAGSCAYGALGAGYTIDGCTNQSTPVRVALPAPQASDPNTIATENLVADNSSAYVRMAGGKIYGWGSNGLGQLGDLAFTDISTPVQIGSYGNDGQPRATKIVCDGDTLYVLDSSGAVKSIGSNSNGQMGTTLTSLRVGWTTTCIDQSGADGVNIQTYACNETPAQKFRIRSDGTIYNEQKNVCLTTIDSSSLKFAACTGGSSQKFTWSPSVPSQRSKLIHTASGKCVYIDNYGASGASVMLRDCTGYANNYLLANNTTFQAFDSSNFSGSIIDLTTDQWALAVLTSSGEVWGAGVNTAGQLGNGTQAEYQYTPVRFAMPVAATSIYMTNLGATTVYDFQNLLAVGTNGRVYGAGSNKFGQLGNGSTATVVRTPVAMSIINGTTVRAQSVQIGHGTTVVYTSDGSVYTVGSNDYGQIGDGTKTDRSTPIRAKYLNDLKTLKY